MSERQSADVIRIYYREGYERADKCLYDIVLIAEGPSTAENPVNYRVDRLLAYYARKDRVIPKEV